MKPLSTEEPFESYRSFMGINATSAEDYVFEDAEYSEEKIFVCDYDKIYICLYKELEEYRISKQSKKKNMTAIWNNLIVIPPSGSISFMEKIATEFPKGIKKNATKNTDEEIVEGSKTAAKIEEYVIQSPPLVNTNNSNNSHPALPLVSESKVAKVEPPKFKKLEKSSKKINKKLRQKEREKGEKIHDGENESELVEDLEEESEETSLDDKSRSVYKIESLESIQDDVYDERNESAEDNALLDESSAFVSYALKKNDKKISIKKEEKPVKASQVSKSSKKTVIEQKPVEQKAAMKPSSSEENLYGDKKSVKTKNTTFSSSFFADLDFNSSAEKLKRPKAIGNEYIDSISLGKEGVNLLMNGQLSQAIHFFTEAISVNMYDLRHYLNRSFCYIRLGAYILALQDAHFVIKHTKDNSELVKAKFRAGQAFCCLQNFEKAEKFLDEAYNFSQADPYILRELMRVKIVQLLHMGFREKDVLEAFKERQSVTEVIAILAERTITEEDDYEYRSECDEEDIYNSDDEENLSFTRILSNMLHHSLYASKKINPVPSCILKTKNPMQQQSTASYQQIHASTEAKKVINTIPQKIPVPTKLVDNKAVWVGNTTPEVTENMLRKKFMKFGKIIAIYKKPIGNYTFIHFDSAKSVTELLSSTTVMEVEGHRLPVKAATKGKSIRN